MNEIKTIAQKFETKEADDGALLVTGYIGTFRNEPDYYNDIITPGAYTKTITERRNKIKFLKNHNSDVVLGGRFKDIYEDTKGCVVEDARIEPTTYGKDEMILIKAGAVSNFSIGYFAIKKTYGDNDIRFLNEVKLFEFSVVPFPADEDAYLIGYKNRICKAEDLEPIIEAIMKMNKEVKEGRKIGDDMIQKMVQVKQLLSIYDLATKPEQPANDQTTEKQPVDYSGIVTLLAESKKLLNETASNMAKTKGV